MTPTDPHFDQRIADWLEEDPTDAPERVLDIVLAALPSVTRQRGPRVSWRFRTWPMSRWPAAVAAVIGVVVVSGLLYGLQGRPPAASNPTEMPTPSSVSEGPRVGSWTVTGSMFRENTGHTATLLQNGWVLVVGGMAPDVRGPGYQVTAELFDPLTETWSVTAGITDRTGHSATLLPNGKVLVAGGETADLHALASAELYDPSTGTWAATGSMSVTRANATATLLPDGKVLVAGGSDNTLSGDPGHSPEIVATAELYDPASGTWSATGNMLTPRRDHSATLLVDGKVLVAGGDTNADLANGDRGPVTIASAELYDPSTGTWAAAGTMTRPHADHGATLLPGGKVLIEYGAVDGAELYDPGTGSWADAGSPNEFSLGNFVTASLLRDGTVLLVFEGRDTELYDPITGSWTYMDAGDMSFGAGATATLLDDAGRSFLGRPYVGAVLVAGGGTNAAELYHPGSGH